MVLSRHSQDFNMQIETGELILAGRTSEPGDKTFGVAIFEAKDEAAARLFMESDAAVVAGLMTAELHPFAVALQRQESLGIGAQPDDAASAPEGINNSWETSSGDRQIRGIVPRA